MQAKRLVVLPGKGKGKGKNAKKGTATVAVPVAVSTKGRSQGPRVSGSRGGGFRVRNTELLQSVQMGTTSSVPTALYFFGINPGLQLSFPWLSLIAQNFQSYQFHSLRFDYRPSCPTTSAGLVAMAFDPDPSNPEPTSLQNLFSFRERVNGAPYSRLTLQVPQRALGALGKRKLIRTAPGVAVSNSALPQFDCGNLYMLAFQGSSTSFIGTLEVSYDVELLEPQPSEGSSPVVTMLAGGIITPTNPFGPSPVVSPGPFSAVVSGGGLHFNFVGAAVSSHLYCMATIMVEGAGMSNVSYSISTSGNTALDPSTVPNLLSAVGTTAWVANFVFTVQSAGDGFVLLVNPATPPSAVSYSAAVFAFSPLLA